MKPSLLAAILALGLLGFQQDDSGKPRRPVVGEMAPTFRLNDHTGQAVSFGGKQDRWTVLAFFPKAATPG